MRSLDVQIRDYIDATSDQLTVDDILYLRVGEQPVRPIAGRETHQDWRRGWILAGAVAAFVFIVLGGVALFVSTQPPVAPADRPTVPEITSVPPTLGDALTPPTAVDDQVDLQGPPFREVDPESIEWNQIDLDDVGGLPTVWRDIDGYVISGNGILTYSIDGRTWTTEPLSPELADYTAFMSSGEWAVAGTGDWRRSLSDSRSLLRSDGSQWIRVDLPDVESAWPQLPIESGAAVVVPDDGGDFGFWLSIADGPFEFQEAPWSWPKDTVDPSAGITILAAPDGGFVALTTVYDVHPDDRDLPDESRDNSTLTWAELWTSPDGITWRNEGLPAFLAADAIGRSLQVDLQSRPGGLVASVESAFAERRDTGETLLGDHTSTNGLAWTPIPRSAIPDPDSGEPIKAECWVQTMNIGYLCASLQTEPEMAFELALSTGAETWVNIAPPKIDFESYGFVGGASFGGVGDILYVWYGDMWIGRFES